MTDERTENGQSRADGQRRKNGPGAPAAGTAFVQTGVPHGEARPQPGHPDYRPVRKGRGASRNDASRYSATHVERVDDGWQQPGEAPEDDAPVTTALPDRTVRLITTNQSPDIPFDQSINPYKGCEHGCVYCFARPTHAYLDLSPGLDFETRLFYKTGVREHLVQELGRRNYQPSVIAMGTNTDPYQPLEKTRRNTRDVLEIMRHYRHPVSIVTKSALIQRDLDVLTDLARDGLVNVMISVTTLSNELKTRLEPRTASPAARLRTIRALSDAGVPVGAMAAPVIPFVNDHELEDIVGACTDAGALAVRYILLRLPLEVKDLFETWLEQHYPLKAARVMAAIRASRRGKAYDARWGTRMRGEGVFADLVASRYRAALRKNGIADTDMPPLRCDLFVRPGADQLPLF